MEKFWGYCKNKTENQRQEALVQILSNSSSSSSSTGRTPFVWHYMEVLTNFQHFTYGQQFTDRSQHSSSLSAIRMVSSAYLRLLMFLPAILIPACASSSPAFLMMYSAATAAKSLQSCPTLCDPIDGSPPGSPVLGILQARTLEWVASSFSNVWIWKVKVKLLSCVQLLATSWTAAY